MILLLKLLASCVTNVRPYARGTSTAPESESAAARKVPAAVSSASTSQPGLGVTGRVQGLVELADLRQQQVGGDEQARERDDRAHADARERFELDVLGSDRIGGAVADVVEETLVAAQRVARLGRRARAAAGAGARSATGGLPERGDRGVDRPRRRPRRARATRSSRRRPARAPGRSRRPRRSRSRRSTVAAARRASRCAG